MRDVANILKNQPLRLPVRGAQTLDQQPEPSLYAHPGSLRVLAANAAASSDLQCTKNELTSKSLPEILQLPELPEVVQQIVSGQGAQAIVNQRRFCVHWDQVTLSTVGANATHFLKLTAQRTPGAEPVNLTPTSHDQVASALVLHALVLLGEEGCRSFSVRKVARRAGVGLGHLQHYFRPKMRLLEAMADVITFELLHHYECCVAPLTTPGTRLLAVIDFAMNQQKYGNWPVLIREFRTMSRDDPSLRPLLASIYQECDRLFRGLFLGINPSLEPAQLQASVNEALSLLSDADDFAGSPQSADESSTSYRSHLTARILSMVHGESRKLSSETLMTGAHLQPGLDDINYVDQLLQLANLMASQTDLKDKMTALCEAGVRLLGCQNMGIFLGQNGRFRGCYNAGNPADVAAAFQHFVIRADEPDVARTIASETCEIVRQADEGARHALFSTQTSVVLAALYDEHQVPCGIVSAGFDTHLVQLGAQQERLLLGLASLVETLLKAAHSTEH